MVSSTHWLASAAGMAVLERGGNAFDAAAAAGFTLQVVEPHDNGPGGLRTAIGRNADLIATWPGSRELYLPVPAAGSQLRNVRLAATYRRLAEEARGGSRTDEIDRARELFYEGFVADEIHRFCTAEGGLLTRDDLAGWRATIEPVTAFDFRGITVCKTGPWGSGPVALQQLALLEGFDLAAMSEEEFVHVVTECAKLAFADRDALYGDADVPLETLLS